MMRNLVSVVAALAVVGLGACATVGEPPPGGPAILLAWTESGAADAVVLTRDWWNGFGSAELTELITALTSHVGEVRRNPFHLTLPAWMANNVRLGGETVGGQGAAAPDFAFGTIYRLRQWRDGSMQELFSGGRVVSSRDRVSELFP